MGERLKLAANGLRELFDPFESGSKPVKAHFNNIGNAGEKLKSADNLASAQDAIKKIFELVDVPAPSAEKSTDLQSLFRNISTSLVNAQKELNQSSLEYAATLDPRLPQTVYGIPSVKAEMRVGFNNVEAKGVNLFFFTSSRQKQEFAESVVSFEVVGTPPQPGPISYGNYVVPVPRLIVVDETRDAILNEILAQKILTGATYTNTRDRAVVLRYEPLQDGRVNRYLVIWYAQKVNQAEWNGISLIYAIGRVTSMGDEVFEFPVSPDESIFEYQPMTTVNNALEPIPVLTIPPGKPVDPQKVEKFAPNDTAELKLGKLSLDLGDVLMNINQIVNDWLDSVKYKPPPQ